MKSDEMIAYLETLALIDALWWYIENVTEDNSAWNDVFFYLRERVRAEKAS